MPDTREIDPRELNDLYLTDIMPVDILQRIQDAFSDMSGMAALTTDAKGKAVTEGSNFTDYCMEMIRKNPTGCKRCQECDKNGALATMKTGHAATYRCHSGLVDFAAPIMVHGKMIGSFIGGQVLPEPPEEDKIKAVAAELGIDPEALWEAAQKVPVRKPEDIEMRANFLFVLAGVLSEMALGRYMADKAGEEIERAAHMKSDFLANMSHEIRTPMNAVIGLAEMALRENLPPLAKEYINQIKTSGRALLNIINDILDFSKIESGKMDIIPVEYETLSIINDVANMMQVKLKDKDVELLLDINPNFPAYVEGDNLRIKQVLTNIVNNAIKFTNSGHVKIRMDFSNIDEEHIKLRFFVEDTGIGIKEEDIGKLFQSFNQVDSKRNRNIEGTGLGLAISKHLLTLMGGNISVQSVYGEGSMFYFYLPQKVVDRNKAVTIKDPDKKFVICNFNSLDLRTQFMKDIARFGIAHQEMSDWHEIMDHLDEYKKTKPAELFIFTEKHCQDDTMNEILMKYPDIKMVMVEDFFMDEKSMFPNLRILKKPLSAILIAMVLNGEENVNLDGDAEAYEVDFIAPDAKILLVDDNSINLTVAEGLMEPMKMHVVSVTSGKEALKRIENEQFDIVFMDHMMPELDGVETTRLIRRFHPNYANTPIIALTANAIEGAKELFMSEGMQDIVTKPIEVRFLAMKLKQWLPPEKIKKATEKDKETAAPTPAENGVLNLNTTPIADLDTASARQLLGNDKLYLNILKKFYESIGNKAMAIKKFYDDQDIHGYTIAVHALKSEARQIGAKELSDMAAELEKAGNGNDMRIIREKTAHVLKKYLTYQQDLKPFFGGDDEADQEKPGIDDATLTELFGKLADAVDELDMDIMEEVADKLKEYGYKGQEEKLCKELLEAISEMDVDACTEIMEKWKSIR